MARSCFVAAVAVAIVTSSSGSAFSQNYVAGLIFEGTGPYAVPTAAYGPQWSWASKVNPRLPVIMVNQSGQILGIFSVRDTRTFQALQTNLKKWCVANKSYIHKVEGTGGGYKITVAELAQVEAPAAAPAAKQQGGSPTGGSGGSLADKFPAKQPPKESPEPEPEPEVAVNLIALLDRKDVLDEQIAALKANLESREHELRNIEATLKVVEKVK